MKIDEALYQLKQNIKMHEIEGTASNQNEREKTLLDYITNLQEENEMYKKELEKADSITQSCIFEGSRSAGKSYRQCLNWLEDYKSRNEKAREMIRFIAYNSERPLTITELNKVYNILGGDDNE